MFFVGLILNLQNIFFIYVLKPNMFGIWLGTCWVSIAFLDSFSTGNWITSYHSSWPNFAKVVFAVITCYLWKATCNAIFRSEASNFINNPRNPIALAQEYSATSKHHHRESLMLSNFLANDGHLLFSTTFCSEDLNFGGTGFYITNANHVIALVCFCPIFICSTLDTKLKALFLSIQCAGIQGIKIQHVFVASKDLYAALHDDYPLHAWRLESTLNHLEHILREVGLRKFHQIPLSWCIITSSLASHCVTTHSLSLFHQARDFPKWIMKIIIRHGYLF